MDRTREKDLVLLKCCLQSTVQWLVKIQIKTKGNHKDQSRLNQHLMKQEINAYIEIVAIKKAEEKA